MNTIFMNFEDGKTFDPHRLLLNLSNSLNSKRSNKYVALSSLSIYYAWKNTKKLYENNKFKTSTLAMNEKFELPDGSYSVSDIQDYFECTFKKHETVTDNSPIMIYVNKKEKKNYI